MRTRLVFVLQAGSDAVVGWQYYNAELVRALRESVAVEDHELGRVQAVNRATTSVATKRRSFTSSTAQLERTF